MMKFEMIKNKDKYMPKIIINFSVGQYSPAKLKFKALFSDVLKWDRKQAWSNKLYYVRATQKMETGTPVSFICEVNDELYAKLITFCKDYKVHYQLTESFDKVTVIEAAPDFTFINVKIDRVKSFQDEYLMRKDLSEKFFEGWLRLLKEDDERINKNLENINV